MVEGIEVELQELIKEEVEFPVMIRKKLSGTSRGFAFFAL